MSMGGESLVPFDPPADMEIYNLYGPTECTVLSTSYRMTSDSKRLPIGMPVNNTRLYVADSFQRLLPIGAMGELLIAGAQVGTGYRTARKRPPRPSSPIPSLPILRTPAFTGPATSSAGGTTATSNSSAAATVR